MTLRYNRLHRLFFALGALLLFLLGGCFTNNPDTPSDPSYISAIPTEPPSFEDFTQAIFCDEISGDTISLHYSLADPLAYGMTDYPITLGSVNDAVLPDENAADLYAQLLSFSKDELTAEEKLTYDSLERHLNLLLSDNYSPYLSELLGPVTGFQAQLPILLAEYRFDTISDVEHYLALLPCIYDYFAEIADFEKEKSENGYFMTDETALEIIAQCEDFIRDPDKNFLISTFEEKLSSLSLPIAEKTEYIIQNQNALYQFVYPAYELLIDTLNECLGSNQNPYGMCHFENGKEYYSLLTRLSTGSDKSIPELKQLLSDTIDTACLTMATALATDNSLYSDALYPQFPETDPEKILQYVVLASEEDFPLIDCGDYEIKYLPESLQEHLSPAMYLTPPIDRYDCNIIYINPVYDMNSLFPTVVHEGYPGHLYQTVSTLSNDISPLRFLLAPTGYEEGWATYVEHYCYQYAGFSDPLTTFLQADQTGTLCLYALADLLIHHEGYTPEELSTLLSVYGFPEEAAKSIYQTLISEPGTYLPYAVGLLEFLELKDSAESLWGDDYSDYRFHSFLVESGPLPFGLLHNLLTDPSF